MCVVVSRGSPAATVPDAPSRPPAKISILHSIQFALQQRVLPPNIWPNPASLNVSATKSQLQSPPSAKAGFQPPQKFLYVRKSWISHNTSTTTDTTMLQRAKELSPLAGSNRGPQDHICMRRLLHQLQSCALPAELRRGGGRRSSRDDTSGRMSNIKL